MLGSDGGIYNLFPLEGATPGYIRSPVIALSLLQRYCNGI